MNFVNSLKTFVGDVIIHLWLLVVKTHHFGFDRQKQPSRGALIKRCSENMQQIYRRTTIPKSDFNKIALQLYWNHTSALVFFCKLLHVFRTHFPKNISGGFFWIEVYSEPSRTSKLTTSSRELFWQKFPS